MTSRITHGGPEPPAAWRLQRPAACLRTGLVRLRSETANPQPPGGVEHPQVGRHTSARGLATEIIAAEVSAVPDPSHALGRIFNRIVRELGGWMGPDACFALVGRALADARRRHACLRGAHLDVEELGLCFSFDGAAQLPPAEVVVAFEDVLTIFIEILGRFVGLELAIHLVWQGWRPKPPPGATTHE